MDKAKATILVNSCDSYEDAWYPFFELFKKYWKDCSYPIILNTESKSYSDSDLNIKTYQMYLPGEKVDYGKRMIDHLRKIDSDYVIMLMDDFFFRAPVNKEKIEEYIDFLINNPDVSYVSFAAKPDRFNIDDGALKDCVLRTRYGEYKINLQAGVWRKEKLIKWLKPHESPWEFETKGSVRSFESDDRFYSVKSDELSPINYGKKRGLTWGIVRGKWVVDDVAPLFEENNIKVNFEQRGIFDPQDFEDITVVRNNNFIREVKSYGFWLKVKMMVWRIVRNIKKIMNLKYDQDWVAYKRRKYCKEAE